DSCEIGTTTFVTCFVGDGEMKVLSVNAIVLACAACLLGSASHAQTRIASAGPEWNLSERSSNAVFSKPVTVDLRGVALKSAVNTVAARANVRIHYQAEMLDAISRPVSLHVRNIPLGSVLTQLL